MSGAKPPERFCKLQKKNVPRKMLESQVLVAMPQRKANCELCVRVGVSPPGKFVEIFALIVHIFLMENP